MNIESILVLLQKYIMLSKIIKADIKGEKTCRQAKRFAPSKFLASLGTSDIPRTLYEIGPLAIGDKYGINALP